MRIRADQMAALDESAQADFHRRLIEFLRAELPDETLALDDVALLERIAESELRSARYGIESDAGIAQFVCLSFAAGADFDEIPEVHAYLREPGLGPEERLDALVDYLNALEDEEGLE